MLHVFLLATLVALAPLASPYAVKPLARRSPSVDVHLASVGNTAVKVAVKNTAAQELSLLKLNSVLDSGPIQRVTVLKDDVEVPFEGVMRHYRTFDLPQDVFIVLAPGKSAEAIFDVAETTDMSAGGHYVLSSQGVFSYAATNRTSIAGVMGYKSNELKIDVDGALAAKVHRAAKHLDPRTNIQPSCSGDKKGIIEKAAQNCQRLASKAAEQARNGDVAKFQEYFRTDDNGARQMVADRLTKVAQECSSINSGKTTLHCNDEFNHCQDLVLAYTLKSKDIMATCPDFYKIVPDLTDQCHNQDRANTLVHEMTHAPGVYSPHCRDYAYGYKPSTALPVNMALLNADNFALYANALEIGC